jgi:polyhydroxyalkanoate synthase
MKRLTNLLTIWKRPRLPVGGTPADVAWQENKWRLLHYRPRAEGLVHRTPILMVPSLINRHYVLDLMPGKSFAEYLVKQGFDVYCIDWGTPTAEDRYITFDDIVDRTIGRAIRRVSQSAPNKKTHVLGYCMGGTLAAIHGAVHPERIASFVALAAPVTFFDDSLLSSWTRAQGFDVHALVNATGNVPWPLLQSAFHMLRPTLTLSKAVAVLDRAWNDEFLDGFIALETWGNDNVSIPGEFYRRFITGLYQQDSLISGRFSLSGQPVDLKRLVCPTLAVSFENDNIVSGPAAVALLDACGATEKQHLHLPGGHVGAVVSKHAAKTLWPQLAAFFARYEQRVVDQPFQQPALEGSRPLLALSEGTPVPPPAKPARKSNRKAAGRRARPKVKPKALDRRVH